LNKEPVEQATFQSIDAASPVLPHAPSVRLFLAGRRGLATGHPPRRWELHRKAPGGGRSTKTCFSPLPSWD
jgi:hypothetical protein